MYTISTKKLAPFHILEILKKYSDENNKFSQQGLIEKLESEYSIKVNRKTIRRHISDLKEFDDRVQRDETIRMMPVEDKKTGEIKMVETLMYSDFYFKHDFSDSQLRLILELVMSAEYIPIESRRELMDKLLKLSSEFFKEKVKHLQRLQGKCKQTNGTFFDNVKSLEEAIEQKRRIAFATYEYKTDKKLHKTGYKTVSPYYIFAKDGKYLLAAVEEDKTEITYYRIDRITNIEILDEKSLSYEQLKAISESKLVRAQIRVDKSILCDVFEAFGDDIRFMNETDTEVTVLAKVDEYMLLQFLKEHILETVVLSPQNVLNEIKLELRKILEGQKDGN